MHVYYHSELGEAPQNRTSEFLYTCESLTLTAELEKRIQEFEVRCYQRLLNISYKDHVTKQKDSIGHWIITPDLAKETENLVILATFQGLLSYQRQFYRAQ